MLILNRIEFKKSSQLKAREEDRPKFEPNVETSFPGLDNLPLRLRNGSRQSFSLSGDQVQSRGKALGIPITETWWMNIQLLTHAYVLTISSKQLSHLIEARNDLVASGGLDSKGREKCVEACRGASLALAYNRTGRIQVESRRCAPRDDPKSRWRLGSAIPSFMFISLAVDLVKVLRVRVAVVADRRYKLYRSKRRNTFLYIRRNFAIGLNPNEGPTRY